MFTQNNEILFSAHETDVWGANSRFIGIFTSEENALEAIKKEYKITDYHFNNTQLEINEGCKSELYGISLFFIRETTLNILET